MLAVSPSASQRKKKQ